MVDIAMDKYTNIYLLWMFMVDGYGCLWMFINMAMEVVSFLIKSGDSQ